MPATRTQDVRLLVCITFMFRPGRMNYLFQVLQTLMDLDVAHMDINVFTETDDPEQIEVVERLFRKFRSRIVCITTHSRPEAKHYIRSLPWEHKSLVRNAFLNNDRNFSHFLYIEEDIRFSPRNLAYFLEYRERLRPHGLIPGFVRVEFNHREGDVFTADQTSRSLLAVRPVLKTDEFDFCCLDEPYTAMHIMDAELVAEYVACRSFDMVQSADIIGWGEPERAAMGLTFENVPEGYGSRTVVPFLSGLTYPDPSCWVHHIPNTYTNHYVEDANFILGKTRLDEILAY